MKKFAMFALALALFAVPMTAHFSYDQEVKTVKAEIVGNYAFADDAGTPAVEATPVAAVEQEAEIKAPTYFDKILAWMAASGGIIAMFLALAEALMRMYPTKKPLSLLIPVQYAVNGLIGILKFIGAILDSLVKSAQNAQNKK